MKEKFEIILSKNRVARELKRLYKLTGEEVPAFILFDLNEIEKATGTLNQPTACNILESDMDI